MFKTEFKVAVHGAQSARAAAYLVSLLDRAQAYPAVRYFLGEKGCIKCTPSSFIVDLPPNTTGEVTNTAQVLAQRDDDNVTPD